LNEERRKAILWSGVLLSFQIDGLFVNLLEGKVTIQILEGWYINLLFVNYPDLAGKFYAYLCSVIAKRLKERELAIKGAAK
jgi:hypothetical protein